MEGICLDFVYLGVVRKARTCQFQFKLAKQNYRRFLMALKISLITVLLIINYTETRCQNNSDSVKSIVNDIARRQILQYKKVGIVGEVSDLWIKYQKLKQFASEQELIDNMAHKSKVVRCYSFMALNETKSNKIFEILVNNLKDN